MKKKDIITFICVFGIAILSTICFLKPHYSVDTVEFLTKGYDSYIHDKFLVDGRIFSVLLLKLVIELPMTYVIPITYVIGILISCLSVMYIRKIMIEYSETEEKLSIMPTIIAYVTIFNFMYVDTFQFLEFPIIALSVLLYAIVSKIIIEKKRGYILKSFILTLIAMFCYQGTINVLIATTFIISIIKNKNLNQKVIIDMLKIGIILVVTILINYIFTIIAGGTSRIDFDIIQNCKNAIINICMIIFNSNNHYPKFLQLIFILIITVYCLIKKVKILNLIWIYCISIMVSMILLIITENGLMNNTSQYGRIFFTIGALIGYIFMYLWCTNYSIRNDKLIRVILIMYFVTILITYFQYTYIYMKGQYIDKYIITNVDNIISEYEKENEEKIKEYCYMINFDNYLLETSYILNKKYTGRNYATICSGRRTLEGIRPGLFLLYADRKIEKTNCVEELFEKHFENVDLKKINLFDKRKYLFYNGIVQFML